MNAVAYSQKRWDGGGGNNLWNNANNWTGNTLPVSTDAVVLDNAFVAGSYVVVLPTLATTVKSVIISPSAGKTIELTLPSTNTAVPGFTINGPGYGLTINNGGIFRNVSGATTGNAVLISDSIKIGNGGKYIHNSRCSHAGNIQVISAASGTESGVVELDIPAASSTISLSGRVFGTLVLKSAAAGGACIYTAAGSSEVIIRNDLELGSGVTFNLNFSDTIFVRGDLTQQSGTFNLGTSIKSAVVHVSQNITQSTGAVITESGSGAQSIVIGGSGTQLLDLHGSIQNSVALVKKGSGMTLLKAPVSLPFKLVLKEGVLVSSDTWLLTLQPSCSVEADTLGGISFVEGPLKKQGLSNSGFLFPVGRGARMRWMRLENATGDFTVEYLKTSPATLGTSLGNGLHHISDVEYWNVMSSSGASAAVKLSFADPHSGGVTDLASLRVSRFVNGIWQNAGNIQYAGTAGSNGWVSSTTASGFSASTRSFALASAMGQENPLPFVPVALRINRKGQHLWFTWKITDADISPYLFEIQESVDGNRFVTIGNVYAKNEQREYMATQLPLHIKPYYRLWMKTFEGNTWYESETVKMAVSEADAVRVLGTNIISGILTLRVNRAGGGRYLFSVYNSAGIRMRIFSGQLAAGSSLVSLDMRQLPAGVYTLKETSEKTNAEPIRFIRK